MAIYKSSFNKKPEKDVEKKPKKEKPIKEQKPKKKIKVNVPFVTLLVFSFLFIVCIMPNNFFKSFLLAFANSLFGDNFLSKVPFCGNNTVEPKIIWR